MSYIDTKAVKKRLGFGVNSEVQRLFTNECAREMNEFVPKDIGILRMLIDIGYDYIEYQSPYAHYQYIGEKYVDPITLKGAFYSPDYGFWSRPNTEKIPSGIPLNYHTPGTGNYWDKRMWTAKGEDIIKTIEKEIKG